MPMTSFSLTVRTKYLPVRGKLSREVYSVFFFNLNPVWDSYRNQPLLFYKLQSSSKRLANFILYETCNYGLEHFNWPYSMRTNLTIEKRSFYYEAD